MNATHGSNSHPDPRARDPRIQKRELKGIVEVGGRIDANLSPSLIDEYKTNNQGTDRRENRRFGVEIATLLFVVATATFTGIQSCQSIRATRAAENAAKTASDTLKLTRQEFASSEAAVLQPNISIRDLGKGSFIQIDVINSGHVAATRVNGVISAPNQATLRFTNATVTAHSASPEYQTGFITRTLGFKHPASLQELATQRLNVIVELNYWSGIEQVASRFCYGLTVSPVGAPDWQDCENQKYLQQSVP